MEGSGAAGGAPSRATRPVHEGHESGVAGGRDALAERFLLEYHRLGGAAAATRDAARAQQLRRRAAAWRTTAGRIRATSDRRWPHWLVRHLQACECLAEVGPEYARQRALLSTHLTDARSTPVPREPGGAPPLTPGAPDSSMRARA